MSTAPAQRSHEETRGGITLSRCARITALLRCPPEDRWKVLAAEGIAATAWDSARSAWNRAIEEEIGRGGDDLLIGFADAVQAARASNAAAPSQVPAAPPPCPPAATPLPPSASPPPLQISPSPWAARAPAALRATTELDLRRMMSNIMPFSPGAPAAPAARRPREEAPRLTLEQYASLAAEIGAFPERSDEIRARYRVQDEAAWKELHHVFHAMFTADPAVRTRWQALVAHYQGWFAWQDRAPLQRAV